MTDPLLSVAPWPDDHGTLKLTGLLTVEICALYRTDTSWPGNLTATEIGGLAREQYGGPWPGYPPCDSESPTVLVYPDGMPGIWGRGATLLDASEALCARMLVLLRDLPALFDALREGASFFAAVAKDRTTTDFIAKAKPLAYLFSDRGYEYEQAAVLARASAKMALAESLDRSKPPPGYGVFEHEFDDDTLTLWVFHLADEASPEGYRGRRSSDRSKVIEWAWEHFDACASAAKEGALC